MHDLGLQYDIIYYQWVCMKFDEKWQILIEYNKHNIWICCHTLGSLDYTLIGYLVYWLDMVEINITVWLYSGIFLNE